MLKLNPHLAENVVTNLEAAFRQRQGLLEEIDDLVENQIPQGVAPLSKDHARFLFFTVFNDHGTKSRNLYARAKDLFTADPEVFDPRAVTTRFGGATGLDRLATEVTARIGARYPTAAAKAWYHNAMRLRQEFDGEPREVFRCSRDAPEVLATICSFRGYGPKTGAMLLRAIVGLGFNAVERLSEVLVPVDIHDSRISFYTGIASVTGQALEDVDYYAHARAVQRLLSDACTRARVSWPDVDRALWLIGSRGCTKRNCIPCPLLSLCAMGQATVPLEQSPVMRRHGARAGLREPERIAGRPD